MDYATSSSPETGEDDFYETKWLILTHLYRDYELFMSSKKALIDMAFFNDRVETRAAFEYLCDYCETLSKAPAKITVIKEMPANYDYFGMDDTVRYQYASRMHQVYEFKKEDLDIEFMQQLVQSEYRFYLTNKFNSVPRGVSDVDIESHARRYVEGMNEDLFTNFNVTNLFDDLEGNLSNSERTPLGVTFMDHMMGGGTLKGELIGVLAPSGGGKSTIAIMALEACVSRGEVCWYFSTEQKLKGDLATRQACLATQTGRDKFKKGFHNIPPDIMNILMSVRPKWEANCKFVDISEKKDIPSIDSLFGPVERYHQKTGKPPGLIIIDWWGRLSDAMIMSQDPIPVGDSKRRFDRDQLHQAKQWMERLACPGLIMHQLSGAANAKGPKARLTSADAQENRAFNNMFDFQVVLGNRNSEDLLKAVTDKARGEARAEINLKLKGLMCRIDIAEDMDSLDMDVYTQVSSSFTDLDDGAGADDYGGFNNTGV